MSLTGTSYASWMQQNPAMVEQAAKRMGAAPAPQVTPQVAPAQTLGARPSPKPSEIAVQAQLATPLATIPEIPTARSGSLRNQLDQIDTEVLQGKNEEMASIGRAGELAAKAADGKAKAMDVELPNQEQRVRELDEVIRGNRDLEKTVMAQSMQDYETYRKPIVDDRSDSDKAIAAIAGIVGAMAMNGMGAPIGSGPTAGGAGLAMGMKMLQDHVNQTFVDQQRKIEAAGRGIDGGSKMLREIAANSASNAELTDRLNANAWGVVERRLKMVEERSKSDLEKDAARQAQLKVREQGLGYARAATEKRLVYQAQMAQANKAATPFAELIRKEQDNSITAAEMKVLTDWRKDMAGINKTEADIRSQQLGDEKTQEEINKLRSSSGSPPGPKTEGEVKNDLMVQGIAPILERFEQNTLKYETANGGEGDVPWYGAGQNTWVPDRWNDTNLVQDRNDAKALANTFMRMRSGSNAPPEEIKNELEAFGIDSPDPKVAIAGRKALALYMRSADRYGRLPPPPKDPRANVGAPVQQSAAPAPAAKPSPPPPSQPARAAAAAPRAATVPMVAPDGSRHDVVLSQVQTARDRFGFVTADDAMVPAAQAPVSEMSEDQYARSVLSQSGY